MRLGDLEYPLPSELIAQAPAAERAQARLLVLERERARHHHARVSDLPDWLRPGDVLVLNDTRVIPARVRARRPTGGRLELLFVRALGDAEWEVLVRGGPRPNERVHFAEGSGEWLEALGDGRWRLRLDVGEPALGWLERTGEVPLPPYIRRPEGPTPVDKERYQTVYARAAGAIAAPTAGLHLTRELLAAVGRLGVSVATLTLHVGPATFLPIRSDDLDSFAIEGESYELPAATVAAIAAARAARGRVVAVGTTTVRALESAWDAPSLRAGEGEARIFIRPGHRFQVVDALLTNFHLPRSTLLALVAAFAGWERIRAAYEEAVAQRYRFYSFGDAMLIA